MLALALLASVSPAWAQAVDSAREAAMVRTVLDQLAAFRRSDWATAYGFASAAIQGQFDPEAFREMVTRGYAPIARSARATVLRLHLLEPGRGYVELRVEGQDGRTIDALYELVEEQGVWKINGVLTKPAEAGTMGSRPQGETVKE